MLSIKSDSDSKEVKISAEKKIADYLSKLEIGEAVDSNEIIFGLRQIRGVKNAKIILTKKGTTEASDSIKPNPEERIRCIETTVQFENVGTAVNRRS
jgi:hypothetical protein